MSILNVGVVEFSSDHAIPRVAFHLKMTCWQVRNLSGVVAGDRRCSLIFKVGGLAVKFS